VEAAAQAGVESVERARSAAIRARSAALQAAESASLALATAESDRVRANVDIEAAEQAESDARDAFHRAEGDAFGKGG
jgi:hypothetical protein